MIAVTGHLGAGKTTLVNHLLRRPGARVGVIVNDLGEINVDAALMRGQIDTAAAISGGCLCCLPDSGGLDDALATLARPRLRLDAVLVEASGIADPIAVARLIRRSRIARARPGGVVEVVDAVHHADTVDTRPEPPARYRAATLVAVTKTDLLEPGERSRFMARLRDRVSLVNPAVELVTAPRGRLDPALVFDVAAEDEPADELPLARLAREDHHEHAEHEHTEHEHTQHGHARSVSVVAPGPVSPGRVVDLLEDPPPGAYRIKGRLAVDTGRGPRGYVVNLVGRLVHVARLPAPPQPAGELVAVGLQLDPATVRERLLGAATTTGGGAEPAGLRRLEQHRQHSDRSRTAVG